MEKLRPFTDHELELYNKGLCPGCGETHTKIFYGPRGGLARNVEMECGVWMNIPDPEELGYPAEYPLGLQMKASHRPIESPPYKAVSLASKFLSIFTWSK